MAAVLPFRRVISLVALWRRQRSSIRETQFHRRAGRPADRLPSHDNISQQRPRAEQRPAEAIDCVSAAAAIHSVQ